MRRTSWRRFAGPSGQADATELRRAAHTLKSNGATLGAASFAEVCRELEACAKSGEMDGAPELIDRIESEYRRLDKALEAFGVGAAS